MSRRRFYVEPENISYPAIELTLDETHHLTRVLRVTPGERVFAFDGCGREYECIFRGVINHGGRLEIEKELADQVESTLDLTLAQGLAKGEKFDVIVQKATELGVTRIAPLATRYTDVKLDERSTARRLERWRRISLEALKQCGRRRLVEIPPPRSVADFLDETQREAYAAPFVFVFSERGGSLIKQAFDLNPRPPAVIAIVGPEGGWSENELEMFEERGCRLVSLGPRILRTETAAIVAVTLIQNTFGDL